MTAAELIARVTTAGVQLRVEAGVLRAWPVARLTDELRTLIKLNKEVLVAALTATEQPEPAHAHEGAVAPQAEARRPMPDHGQECMRCAHLIMRVERHSGTRRIYWWRCEKGHALMEGREFGERVLLASPECDVASDFKQWWPGAR